MVHEEPTSPIFYVPFHGADPDDAVRAGAAWLMNQPGSPLVLLHAKNMYDNNRLLATLTRHAYVAKPIALWQSGWRGGPVLAPWPSEEVPECITDSLARRATAVCVLMWGDSPYQTSWLRAKSARHLASGELHGGPVKDLLPPVVEVAMKYPKGHVNHANGLVGSYERDSAILTLQHLHLAGYRFSIDNLFTWALPNGFDYDESRRLVEYARKVEQGHRFRLRYKQMCREDIVASWESDAAALKADS